MRRIFLGIAVACVGAATTPLAQQSKDAGGNQGKSEQRFEYRRGGAPYVNFCKKKYLQDHDGRLYCNWADSFALACILPDYGNTYIEKGGAISGPTSVGLCSDKDDVVKVESN